jgi:class 3 adenylate cyclase/tetratricopeptide (TPR) repeat protein
MRCPNCQSENRAAARFCDACGHALQRPDGAAHGVGTPTPPLLPGRRDLTPDPRSYTPRHLAERIFTMRSSLEGERKQVTVLFVDVQGSMDLAEMVDPEEWHRIMDRFFAILAEGVHRFEGTVNQFTGDGIMALFGAPLAHEDHARRACYAALHLRDQLRGYAEELKRTAGLRFSVRMGLNSGEVVVGKIGDDLRMDYTAQGHTVGLAQRMEQLADPGTAYLTEHTAALVDGFFQLRDLGGFQVKGVREQLHVYQLDGVGPLRTRLDVSRTRGFSRFVGREHEMARLDAALSAALDGRGAAVALVADAGVGKSRLCYEFIQGCRTRGIAVHETHCVAHGTMVPFLPVLDLIRDYFGIRAHDSDEAARRKVAGTLLLLDEPLTDGLPLLLEFLGIPDPQRPALRVDPEARQRQLVALAQGMMRARSRREPAVLLIEDLQWIDGGSETFFESLLEALPGTRTLLLTNFRPEYRTARRLRREAGPPSPYLEIELLPLGSGAVSELLTELLGTDDTLGALTEHIRTRTGGNPFFVEELVQSLVEGGALVGARGAYRLVTRVDDVPIPPTVQAVLAARIDRLPELDKALLQTASVIGREVPEPVLLGVLESLGDPVAGPAALTAAVGALVSAGFLYEEALYPEPLYAFNHQLTREVAYRSQLAERRARVHASVAEVISALYPDKLDERAALLAHHWQSAGNALAAARWNRRAAEWVRVRSLREALRHWHNVRVLLAHLPDSADTSELALDACVQLLEVGWRLGISAEEAAALFAEGNALAQRIGDKRALAMLVTAYGVIRSHFGSADEFVHSGRVATQLAQESGDAALQLVARVRLVIALGAAGQLTEALTLTSEVVDTPPDDLRLGMSVLGYSPHLRLMREHGKLLIDLGRLQEGQQYLERAMPLARQHGDLEVLGFLHGEYVSLARIRRDTETALAHARETMRIADTLGSPFFRANACLSFGQAHILGSQWEAARGALDEGLAIARAGQAGVETEALALAWLAGVHRGLGNLQHALALADEALATAVQRCTRLAECIACIARARVLLRLDCHRWRTDLEAALTRALELVESTGARSNEPFVRLERARLAKATGDVAIMRRELGDAARQFIAIGAPGRAERLRRDFGEAAG